MPSSTGPTSTGKGPKWDERTGTPRDEKARDLLSKAHGRYSASGQREKRPAELPKGPAGAHGAMPKPKEEPRKGRRGG
jgi:hypothetical protein